LERFEEIQDAFGRPGLAGRPALLFEGFGLLLLAVAELAVVESSSEAFRISVN
jgi:hypothetical protein